MNSILLICILTIVQIKTQFTKDYFLKSVTPSNPTINAITNYTWEFDIPSNFTTRTTMELYFASNVTVSTSSKVYYQGVEKTPIVISGNMISFAYPAGTVNGTIYIVVTQITNPSQKLSTVYMNSTINSVLASTQTLLTPTVFSGGILQNCSWKFTGTTQMQKQNLSIYIKTANTILAGNRRIKLTPTDYTNAPYDSYKLSNSSASLTCKYSFDNLTFYTGTSCNSSVSNQININITLNTSLVGGSALYLLIQQINNPPTTTISLPNSYSVITYGIEGVIDNPPTLGCTIQSISATTFTGYFTSTQLINSNYSNPTISINSTVDPSIKIDDYLIMAYSTGLLCTSNRLKFSRNNNVIGFSNKSNTNVERTYQANSSDFSSATLILQLDCTIVVPTSATPATFTFNFKRGTPQDDYMIITATLTAQTATLLTLAMTTNTTQMFTLASYTFPIKVSHPLSKNGRIDFDLSNAVDLTNFSNSCSVSWNSTTGIAACSVTDATQKIIQLNFTFNDTITANTTMTVKINNLINPKNPSLATFGIVTYYDASVSTSKVQSNSLVANFTPTVHTVTASLLPTAFSVYDFALFTITYNNQLSLPINSTFTITFPTDLTNVTYNNGTMNTSVKSFTYNKTLPQNIVTLKYGQTITGGSTFVFSFNARMPKQLTTLASIIIVLSDSNGTAYQTVTSGLGVSVSITTDATYTISPAIKTTGSSSAYNIELVTQVPHDNLFYVYVTPPSDLTYTLASITCSTICQPTLTKINSTTFQITTANLTLANQTTIFVFKLSNFTNLRSVSTSGVWKFESLSTNKSLITSGSATYNITQPNTLTGFLSLDDPYYRNNTNLVNLNLTFFNVLKTTDIIRLQIPNTAYTSEGNISCHIATCVQDTSISSTQLIYIDVTNVAGSTVMLHIDGLRSSKTTTYTDTANITVTTMTSNSEQIDTGIVKYNISCSSTTLVTKQCKQCYQNGTCKSCYYDNILALNFYNGTCTSNCTSLNQFLYASTGNCQVCSYPCRTCLNSTSCLTCQNVTKLYWNSDYTCSETCAISNGFFIKSYSSSGYQIYQCVACSSNCLVCTNETYCTACSSTTVISENRCLGDCPTNYYNSNGCKACDVSCTGGCTGGTNKNCEACATGYFNYSGQCVTSCPSGTAKINTADCGCSSACLTCSISPSNCLSCNTVNNISYFSYNGGCVSECPIATYRSNSTCVDCAQGCGNCSSNTCYKCISGWYIYENDCFSDCNTISSQYDVDSTGQKCILCPNGCDTCEGGTCTSCLNDYTLNSTACVLTCSLTNSCVEVSPVPDRVLPIPGTISAVIWLAIAIILKIIIWKSYLPYVYLMIGAIIELILTLALTISVGQAIPNSRLLVQISTAHRSPVLALFIVGLLLNYISNIIYIVLFCKYIRPLMPDRQIDIISNGFILVLGTILNYRVCLSAYSKLFPKPQIPIDNHTRLTPIHYLSITTVILSAITIAAASVLIYNQYALTDMFMLSIDYLIVTLINILFTVWMVSISKSDEYYQNDNKKYSIEQFYRTEQGLNQGNNKNDKQHSKANFNNDVQFAEDQRSEEFEKEDYYKKISNNNDIYATHNYGQSDSENLPLPLKVSVLQAVPMKIQSKVNVDDLQLQDNSFTLQASKKQGSQIKLLHDKKSQRGLPIKHGKQSPKNYSKQKNKLKHSQSQQKSANFSSGDIKIKKQKGVKNNILKTKMNDFTDDNAIEDEGYRKPRYEKSEDENIKLKKPGGLKSQHNQSGPKMLKTNRVELFESQAGQSSQVEDIDIQQIIQSKIMDIKQNETKTENQNELNSIQNQDISPSWFNIQNQRFDISDIEDKQ